MQAIDYLWRAALDARGLGGVAEPSTGFLMS